MNTCLITEMQQSGDGASNIAVISKDAAMQELHDELLAIENDRFQGHSGCTLDELDLYLDDVIFKAKS